MQFYTRARFCTTERRSYADYDDMAGEMRLGETSRVYSVKRTAPAATVSLRSDRIAGQPGGSPQLDNLSYPAAE